MGVLELKKRKEREAELERQQEEVQRVRQEQRLRLEYKQSRADGYAERRATGQLAAARVVCETMDCRAGKVPHVMWPPMEAPSAAAGGTEAAGVGARGAAAGGGTGNVWGERGLDSCDDDYDPFQDSLSAAGGMGLIKPPQACADEGEETAGGCETRGRGADAADAAAAAAAWEGLPAMERLRQVTTYLRDTHTYCFFCGTQYDDAFDMEQNCPGPTEGDH